MAAVWQGWIEAYLHNNEKWTSILKPLPSNFEETQLPQYVHALLQSYLQHLYLQFFNENLPRQTISQFPSVSSSKRV